MKAIKFNLTNKFSLIPVTSNKIYELENNSCILEITADIDAEMAYELHIENEDGKTFRVMDKHDGILSTHLSSSILSKAGKLRIQLRGAKEVFIVESNYIDLEILTFINAKEEVPPEEQSEFEKWIIKVEALEADKADKVTVESMYNGLESHITGVSNGLTAFAQSQAKINDQILVDILDIGNELDNKADADEVQEINTRLDTLDNETLDIYQKLQNKADSASVYDKQQVNALLTEKANNGTVEALNTMLRAEINIKADYSVLESKTSYQSIAERLYNNTTKLTDEQKLAIEDWLGLAENYLTNYNTIPYSVNADYVPAHKKYVDSELKKVSDLIGSIDSLIGSGEL